MEAFHLEGPYISPDDGPRGAHPAHGSVRPISPSSSASRKPPMAIFAWSRFRPNGRKLRSFIEKIVEKGVVASIGHTRASSLSDRRRRQRRRNAIHSSRQRRRRRSPQASQLSLGAAGRRSPGRQLHRGWIPSAAVVPERRAARQGTGAVAPGHRRRDARRLPARPLSAGRSGRRAARRRQCAPGRRLAAGGLRAARWIKPSRTSCELPASACAKPLRSPLAILRASAESPSRQRGLNPGERADLVRFRFDEATGQITILETFLSGRTSVFDVALV